ncbi:MAG: hypothetical protein HUJ70_10500, partial [Pseudobutyrivibrio sp.]|nr:hypothetical protein [Pseudobutyrivibrio sp.]
FANEERWYQKKHENYTAMMSELDRLSTRETPENMALEECIKFEDELMHMEKLTKEYIKVMDQKQERKDNENKLLEDAKSLVFYLKSYREGFHEAYDEKLNKEMDAYDQKHAGQSKVDSIVNAIAGVLLANCDKADMTKGREMEEMVRKSQAFRNMLKAAGKAFDGQSAIDYYNQLAKTDPMKVFEAYADELKRASAAAKNKEGEKKEKANDAVKKNDNANNDHAEKSGKAEKPMKA